MIPVSEPILEGKEKKYVDECFKDNFISSNGKFIEKFEEEFSKFCGVKYGVACSNGTTALHLALASLGIGKGDEVIVPSFTMIASANAVVYTGATPVFVDADINTWNININKIERAISEKTKAIMVVHTYGYPVDMDKINELASKYNLYVIEDTAEAHGAEYRGKKVGSLGDIACFSFYANKIITTGEGGMVVTNNQKLVDRARSLRNHCFGTPRFKHHELGFNYRMTNIQAAIGLAQVENIDYLLKARNRIYTLYNEKLKDIEGIQTMKDYTDGKNVCWMYCILVDKEKYGMSKDDLMVKLKEVGVDTRSFFLPMHKQPVFVKDNNIEILGNFDDSEELFEKGLYLPSSSYLKEEEIDSIVSAIRGFKK